MRYAVKEVFYTLQGEGFHAGRAAVFVRFAGCNLWNGRESGRAAGPGGCSRWCDTDFVGTDGKGGGVYHSAAELAAVIEASWPGGGAPMAVLTGGEPTLQVDEALCDALHARGFFVAMESNGTRRAPQGLDWLCVSPKAGAPLMQVQGDELKVVILQDGFVLEELEALGFTHLTVQPLDGPDRSQNTALAVDYCLRHPRWRLGIQLHKAVGLP